MSRTARSLPPLKFGSQPIPSLKVGSHLILDSTERIIKQSDLDSDDNVDFEAVIDEESPINCPFIDYEAVESEDGREITDSEDEEAIPPRKRVQST